MPINYFHFYVFTFLYLSALSNNLLLAGCAGTLRLPAANSGELTFTSNSASRPGLIATTGLVAALSGARSTGRGSLICTSTVTNRAVVTAGLTHESTALNARDIHSLEFMAIGAGLHQAKLNILALDKVLVLRVGHANGRIVDEDILTGIVAVVYGNETITSLVVKPLNLTQKAVWK
jgi:hypothetical protein